MTIVPLSQPGADQEGFRSSLRELALEYEVIAQLLKARTMAGLTQEAVAQRMGTTKSAVPRLEGLGKHAPSLSTLQGHAQAVGCELQVRLAPER